MSAGDSTRTETDSMGAVKVPADRLWGAQTQRALEVFGGCGPLMPLELVHALAMVKRASARANRDLGVIDAERAGLVDKAGEEAARGDLDGHFPLPVWQSGSGTSTNMNVNEVLSNRAAQLAGRDLGDRSFIHPNDHVNRSQSTNDAFPTASHLAAALAIRDHLLPALDHLADELAAKAGDWAGMVKIGRTHLMDAVPLTLGQEFSGYAAMLGHGRERLEQALAGLYAVPLGGTAVGTGLGAPEGFGDAAVGHLAGLSGLPLACCENRFASQAGRDALAAVSAALRGLAASMYKIASDVRLLASGPRCGLGELVLPAHEPGSSIMPGKVNPTQCEAACMICLQVLGLDAAVAMAATQGHLELFALSPMVVADVLEQVRLLAHAAGNFARQAVARLEPRPEIVARHVENSLMLVTALVPALGYDRAARAAHHARDKGLTLRRACIDLGLMDGDEFDALVRPGDMV